ncbi:GerMN domain-containing protein [Sediminibacillus albus]|uniref:Germination protein M n=1 Tax=Sediminibacillus albus TaxID=407036 RepID=A0A1G9BRU9_9BACI|nr:GerMN domain-containing protein [Sediminibacillus albus]SDK41685.1 germination protein M [Sediminibacillus albus]
MRKQSLIISAGVLGIALVMTGCGVFQGEQTLKEMDAPPEEATFTDNLDEVAGDEPQEDEKSENGAEDSESEAETTTVERQLYLLDANGMVVPQTLELPNMESKEVAKQALEYLVKDGPVTELLPDGFEAVLPAGTAINSLNLKDGVLTVDVSKEFADYRPEDEQKILQSMTYTLTQFDNVERVKLWINGEEKKEMPVSGTPIGEGVSRANGINIYNGDNIDLMESEAVTLYYPAQQGEQLYHVPVTQHVEKQSAEDFASIVQALVEGPANDLNLLNVFNSGTSLTADPTIDDGVLTLDFNENILENAENASIADEVMETLVLTLTDQPGVEAVDINVGNLEQVFNEKGTAYTEPVTRNTFVPTGSL